MFDTSIYWLKRSKDMLEQTARYAKHAAGLKAFFTGLFHREERVMAIPGRIRHYNHTRTAKERMMRQQAHKSRMRNAGERSHG